MLVAACGRRWGKTEGLSVDVAVRVLTEPDLSQLLVGPTKDQADGLFDAVDEKIQEVLHDPALLVEFPLVKDLEIKRSPYCHIRRLSDGQIVLAARSSGRNGRNLRGKGTTRKMKRFRVVVDEAAYVPDVAIDEAIRPMLATVKGGGQLVMISSPNGRRGPFFDAFVKGSAPGGAGKARAVRLPSSQNPLVDRDFLEEMREEMTDRQFRAEFLAEFVDAAGQVFTDADIDGAICDDDYGAAPLWGCVYVVGVDFGRRRDWTVITVGEATPHGVRLVELVRVQGLAWGSQVEAIAGAVARWGVRSLVCDATGIGDVLSADLILELAARSLPCEVEAFTFTGQSKPLLIDGLSIALATKRLRYPAHPIVISELRNFEVIGAGAVGSGREKMAAARGHDDVVCSLALMVRGAAPWLSQGANLRHGGGVVATSGGSKKDKDLEWSGHKPKQKTLADGFLRLWRAFVLSLCFLAWVLRWRLLTLLYRFGPGRRAGASLRRLTSGLRAGSIRSGG